MQKLECTHTCEIVIFNYFPSQNALHKSQKIGTPINKGQKIAIIIMKKEKMHLHTEKSRNLCFSFTD